MKGMTRYGFSETVVMKVNPKLMGRMSEFELGFRPVFKCLDQGEYFVSQVEYMGDYDLYRWNARLHWLQEEGEIYNPSKGWLRSQIELAAEPGSSVIKGREIQGRIKHDYNHYEQHMSKNFAFCRENFLSTGCLPILPKVEDDKIFIDPDFVRYQVEEVKGGFVAAPWSPDAESERMTFRDALENGYNDPALGLNLCKHIMFILMAVEKL